MAEASAGPSRNSVATSDLTGSMVGRYVIEARLGSGGMGEVYRAEDTALKRTVALKRITRLASADPHSRERLWKEAECASQLNDPHIAAIYDVLDESGSIFLVLEYVEGSTLRRLLSKPLPLPDFLRIAAQCAAGLAAAHKAGVQHGDIKPENIMVTPAGDAKLLDFGVARHLPEGDETATRDTLATPQFSGTIPYMAPETLRQAPSDARADIFSLGVVFYEALAGRNPFRAERFLDTCERVLHHDPASLSASNPDIPPELDRIVHKMLEKDPAERYASAADVAVDLEHLRRSLAEAGRVSPGALRRGRKGLRPLMAGIAGVALVVLVAITPAREWIRARLGAASIPREKQVAVLPFTTLGADLESAALGDGLTETLTTKLTQLTAGHTISVVPASEIRGKKVTTVVQALQEFGINLALEGGLQRADGMVRINYSLVDARTRRQLRAESFTVAASDPFAVEDRVVRGAIQMLDLEVQPGESDALRSHGTQAPAAYESYLEGRGYLQNYDKPENINSAIHSFEGALAVDPNYALAYAGLGLSYWQKYLWSKQTPWVDLARPACERAASLDGKLAEAQICLGTLLSGTGEYKKAAAEFDQALQIEPTSDLAYRGLASAYEHMGKASAAEKTYQRAIALRPRYWAGYAWLGVFYIGQARYADAANMFSRVVSLVPDSFAGYYNLGAAYLEVGQYANAMAALRRSVEIRPNADGYSNLGTAYFYLRQFADAAASYQQALNLNPDDYGLWGNLAEAQYWAPGRRAECEFAYRKALALASKELRVNPRRSDVLGDAALYHAMIGDEKEAHESLARALALTPRDAELLLDAAKVYARLGETQPAIDAIEKSLGAGLSGSRVKNDPLFENLRGNARFVQLLQGPESP